MSEVPEVSAASPNQAEAFLEGLLVRAKKGELAQVVVGYVTASGSAMVESTPISAVMLNHIHRLLDRRVARQYDQVLAAAAVPARPPSGPVRSHSPAAAQVPRAVRREVARAQRKLAKKKNGKASQLHTGEGPDA